MGDIAIVANPRAANGKAKRQALRLHRALETSAFTVELQFTAGPGDATRLAREAIAAKADAILCVGGDGSLNEIVNGFAPPQANAPPHTALAVAPVGTGTDFAKTLRQTAEVSEVVERLQRHRRRPIDLGLVEFADLTGRPASRCFVNIAEFGSGGAVVEKVNRTTKTLGGKMSFLMAILSVMPKYANRRVRYRIDGGSDNTLIANNFIVANGRYFGGGLKPAPNAELDDGLFDIVVIGDLDFRTIRRHLKDLRAGTHLSIPGVTSARGREVATWDTGGALLDLDGELVGRDPTRFACVPRALDLLV